MYVAASLQDMENRLFDLMLLLFLFLLASEMVVQVGAQECEYKSSHFKGLCFVNQHCNLSCQKEGFESGQCKGLLRRCMCTKQCGGGGGGGGPPPPYAPDPPYAPNPPYAPDPPFAPNPPLYQPNAPSYEEFPLFDEEGGGDGSGWGPIPIGRRGGR